MPKCRVDGTSPTERVPPGHSLLAREGVHERLLTYQAACPEDYALEYLPSSTLQHAAPHLLEAVFALTKHNMRPFHPPPGCDMAWADGDKWRDLTALPRAHYLLLLARDVCIESLAGVLYVQETRERDEDSSSGGRGEEESDQGCASPSSSGSDDEDALPNDPVLYCYDLQIHPAHQARGLGKYLMSMYLDLAQALGRRPMLTVFKANARALEFYAAFGWGWIAASFPLPRHIEDVPTHSCFASGTTNVAPPSGYTRFGLDRNDPSLHLGARRAQRIPYHILSRPLDPEPPASPLQGNQCTCPSFS